MNRTGRKRDGAASQTVLLVDNDGAGLQIYKFALERTGFSVLIAESAEEALPAAIERRPDIIVSDVQMGGADGISLCARVRAHPRTAKIPFLLMSGLSCREQDQLEGLERGADDYLLKPFSYEYLVAKVRSVLRRFDAPRRLERILVTEELQMDVAARTVKDRRGRHVRLTRKEFDLLTAFLERPGRVLSTRFLLESVWGYDLAEYNERHTVTVHLSSLRRKLGAGFARRLVTVSGAGYRFDPNSFPL